MFLCKTVASATAVLANAETKSRLAGLNSGLMWRSVENATIVSGQYRNKNSPQ